MPEVMNRVKAVREFRLASKSAPTRALAAQPTRFHTEFIPKKTFIALPQVSSERRQFVPMAFLKPATLCGDKLRVIEGAQLFHFGVLMSSMHMAWMRRVCGRLESRYQYSALIVYNNFPWPESAIAKQLQSVENAAQDVLDARAEFRDASLSDLYDPITMPPVLVKAHQKLDAAVDAAYGKKNFKGDAERVAFLFTLYQKYTSLLPAETKPTRAVRAKKV